MSACKHCDSGAKPNRYDSGNYFHAVKRYGRDGLGRLVLCLKMHDPLEMPEDVLNRWLELQIPDKKT